jgi:hypothetical protein
VAPSSEEIQGPVTPHKTAPEQATTFSVMRHPSSVLNAAKIVLDRAEKLKIRNPPDDTLIDLTKLSTPLLRMQQAELR